MAKKYGGVDNGANLDDVQEAFIVGETKETPLPKRPTWRIVVGWVVFIVLSYYVVAMLELITGIYERQDVSFAIKLAIPLLPTLVRVVYTIQARLRLRHYRLRKDC